MKKTDLIDVIGKIDPTYVKEAEQWSKAAEKKRNFKHFAAMAACVCILLLGAVVTFELAGQGGKTEAAKESASPAAEGAGERTAETGADEAGQEEEKAELAQTDGAMESATEEDAADSEDRVIINEAVEVNVVAIDIGYESDVVMDAEELEAYYGVTVFPDKVPEDLVAAAWEDKVPDGTDTVEQTSSSENKQLSIQKELAENGEFSGRIYYNKEEAVGDNNTFCYESQDESRSLKISVRTKDTDMITEFEEEDLDISQIHGVEVTIGKLAGEEECYVAIFAKEGVTFTVQTKNLTEQEFLMILKDLC